MTETERDEPAPHHPAARRPPLWIAILAALLLLLGAAWRLCA